MGEVKGFEWIPPGQSKMITFKVIQMNKPGEANVIPITQLTGTSAKEDFVNQKHGWMYFEDGEFIKSEIFSHGDKSFQLSLVHIRNEYNFAILDNGKAVNIINTSITEPQAKKSSQAKLFLNSKGYSIMQKNG